MKLILASASPRREELLRHITEDFEVKVSNFDEDRVSFNNDFQEYVMNIAKGKALDVSCGLIEETIVIGCDTIVEHKGKVFGKPKNNEEAFRMIKSLSGDTHKVYSGIALVNSKDKSVTTDYCCTEVKFSMLSDEEISEYINLGESLDKAGAYGIQGKASVFVAEIYGCYYNVVGLPLNKLYAMLKNMN